MESVLEYLKWHIHISCSYIKLRRLVKHNMWVLKSTWWKKKFFFSAFTLKNIWFWCCWFDDFLFSNEIQIYFLHKKSSFMKKNILNLRYSSFATIYFEKKNIHKMHTHFRKASLCLRVNNVIPNSEMLLLRNLNNYWKEITWYQKFMIIFDGNIKIKVIWHKL